MLTFVYTSTDQKHQSFYTFLVEIVVGFYMTTTLNSSHEQKKHEMLLFSDLLSPFFFFFYKKTILRQHLDISHLIASKQTTHNDMLIVFVVSQNVVTCADRTQRNAISTTPRHDLLLNETKTEAKRTETILIYGVIANNVINLSII